MHVANSLFFIAGDRAQGPASRQWGSGYESQASVTNAGKNLIVAYELVDQITTAMARTERGGKLSFCINNYVAIMKLQAMQKDTRLKMDGWWKAQRLLPAVCRGARAVDKRAEPLENQQCADGAAKQSRGGRWSDVPGHGGP